MTSASARRFHNARPPVTAKLSAALAALFCCLALVCLAAGQASMALPRIESETLAGGHIVLPDALTGRVAVLIFGFSKASRTPASAWGGKLYDDLGNKPGFEVYQLPVLEDVPRLIRGIVISGIKKGLPENRRDHFVPVLRGEAELKKVVNHKEPDDAYLVVVDRSGKIVQQRHGQFDAASYSLFRRDIEALLGQP